MTCGRKYLRTEYCFYPKTSSLANGARLSFVNTVWKAGRSNVSDPKIDDHFYHHFAASLADEGFITYAPQNPYIGHDDFRNIQRMAHPLKLALFSFILGPARTNAELVDDSVIRGSGADWVLWPVVRRQNRGSSTSILDRYALSVCSGDFNEWVWKTTNVFAPQSLLANQ